MTTQQELIRQAFPDKEEQRPVATRSDIIRELLPLVGDLRASHAHVLDENKRLQNERDTKSALVATLEAALAATRLQVKELERQDNAAENTRLAKEVVALKNQLAGAKADAAEARRARQAIDEKLKRKTADHDMATKTLLANNDEIRKALEQRDVAKAEVDRLQKDYEAARQDFKEIQADNNTLTKERDAAEAEARRVNAEMLDIVTRERQVIEENQELKSQIEQLREAVATSEGAPPQSGQTVAEEGLRRHLETAVAQFEEAPDKSLRAITRALSLLNHPAEKETTNE
ncbi:hypothetical protein V6D40_07185 [Corynebacterium sp. Q4381]|uniref:hypothetical protein n=1 Tax=Corynebacterium sp. Marseille-Q4381 TaxID=3121597 RepID=UPI002FE6892F